jgi:hypothetical protein|tara:strand:+ start:128 stop:424 length:297 start_codon:yes stop_codon:yes gene_type:complete
MVETKNGTLLGKCAIDGQPIYEGSGFRSQYCTVSNGRWISGDTLLKLYKRTFEAFLAHNEDAAAEKAILLDRLEKYGWQTDPETGRLTKVLNRSEEME